MLHWSTAYNLHSAAASPTMIMNILNLLQLSASYMHPSAWAGVPLYVLEDRLLRVANWEDQTKEDLTSKFCKRGEKLPISLLRRQKTSFHWKNTKSYPWLVGIFWIYLRRVRRSTLVGGPPHLSAHRPPAVQNWSLSQSRSCSQSNAQVPVIFLHSVFSSKYNNRTVHLRWFFI